ncbi:winged helix-turn-helix domain-containing protein [Alteromonas lipolytica]|uniref:OmpR/PhoB-type domain-containing protein n=1 Tax=Alteromonas lipolytica TaxID=1856405 RepID=A0A1E8FG60_9ALTE|nr:helix-turn-helix domain-containing protein [Alteromonas lipolytica]OFI34932.1 hypothetical protein BFC17_15310 [Alteromonas lipolytica]GGF55204.1 hypothetical protein GCM10011338_04300 [Alteromonas lipolytica]
MTYDKSSRTITDTQGVQRILSPKCGLLFELLIDNQGHIVTRETMRETIWQRQVVSEDMINHLVCRLRKELNSLEQECPWQIEVIPKLGYRLVTETHHHLIKAWLQRWIDWVNHIIK